MWMPRCSPWPMPYMPMPVPFMPMPFVSDFCMPPPVMPWNCGCNNICNAFLESQVGGYTGSWVGSSVGATLAAIGGFAVAGPFGAAALTGLGWFAGNVVGGAIGRAIGWNHGMHHRPRPWECF